MLEVETREGRDCEVELCRRGRSTRWICKLEEEPVGWTRLLHHSATVGRLEAKEERAERKGLKNAAAARA